MNKDEALALFLDRIPSEYPEHMLCFFAGNGKNGRVLPFLNGLSLVLAAIDTVTPGYASEMLDRIAGISGTGEAQYEAVLQVLAEVYVTGGAAAVADRDDEAVHFLHEPGASGKKNPEFEVRILGRWCAIEVKTPKLIQHGRIRAARNWQFGVRLPEEFVEGKEATLPRDNPVKDFLISAEAKFGQYELYRPGALRILVIVWDDYCNEPIAALKSPVSGLLTENSFHRGPDDSPVRYPHLDGIIVVRHQHQIIRATRCEPLVDGVGDAMAYRHDAFPPKAFIEADGGRVISGEILHRLNAVPLHACLGAEYQPVEVIMWMGGGG
jgi:hypothetical protein